MDEMKPTEAKYDSEQDIDVGYWQGNSYHIQDVRISLLDHPECLDDEDSICEECSFFHPRRCPFLFHPNLRENIKTLFALSHERIEEYYQHQQAFLDAIYSELKTHGRPLHYTVLARMIQDRYPELDVTELGVARMMSNHPELFERIRNGVYQCR